MGVVDLPPPPPRRFTLAVPADLPARFERDGFAHVPRLTSDEELEWLRVVFDALFTEKVGGFDGGYFDLSRPYDADGEDHLPQVLFPELRVPALQATDYWNNARAVTAAVLGVEEPLLQGWGHMIWKPALHGHETPWHQDEAYWEPDLSYVAVGTWVPLDDTDEANGCMCFVPGSHRGPVRSHRHIGDDPAVHGLYADDLDPERDLDGWVAVPLRAGGATFHHPRTLHRTGPNATDRQRRAVAVEFQTKPVRRPVPEHRPWHDAGKAAWAARNL